MTHIDKNQIDQCAFTIAVGQKSYKEMAVNLALSVAKNSPGLPFFVFTDCLFPIPRALKAANFSLVEVRAVGVGFSSKLYLSRLAPGRRSLFIDADCLVYSDLAPIFDAAKGRPVGVFGFSKREGEFFCDVKEICRSFKCESIPCFNGGLYYIERNDVSASIYSRARDLEPIYDELNLVRLRGQANEEILMAISLAEHGIEPVTNDGTLYADFQWWPAVRRLNVVRSVSAMENPPPSDPRHQDMFPADFAKPIVVHFLGHHAEYPLYRRECLSLRMSFWIPAPDIVSAVFISPFRAIERARDVLRPAYRQLFGIRKVRKSRSRLVTD